MKRLIAILLFTVFIIGCGGREERTWIMASIMASYNLDRRVSIEGYRYDGFEIIPLATVNEETLYIDSYSLQGSSFSYSGSIPWVNPGDECNLRVDYGEGECEATELLPDEFSITSPDADFILYQGDDLNITWSTASGADWYWLAIWMYYSYIDTLGDYDYFSFTLDTILDVTTYTMTASRLFPADVDSIEYGYGDIHVEAVSGPEIVPGQEGNITGDAFGFFWCSYYAERVEFFIEQAYMNVQKNHDNIIKERHLEAMRKFALENE